MAENPEGVVMPVGAAPSLVQGDVPETLRRRYFTEGRGAQLAYYTDHTAQRPAFQDVGRRLATDRTSPEVIKDMLAIAEHRGWSQIQVRGSVEFRREVWLQAQVRGLDLGGYRPSGRDEQELERRTTATARDAPDGRTARAAPDPRSGVTGELIEAGAAPYKHRSDAEESAFIKLRLENGRQHTVWGVGLPAALEDSGAQVGDTITVRRTGAERVTRTVRQTDKATGEVHRERKVVPRNLWQIVADQFREATPEQAARDPDMRGAQRQMAIVESVVRSRAEPAIAERIIAAARTRIADWLERGARFEPQHAPERWGAIEADRGRERQRSR